MESRNDGKAFGDGTLAVNDLALSLDGGEFVVFVGRFVAGFIGAPPMNHFHIETGEAIRG